MAHGINPAGNTRYAILHFIITHTHTLGSYPNNHQAIQQETHSESNKKSTNHTVRDTSAQL